MVTLTLQDKKELMDMLCKHYSIEESAFIKAIAQNEEEEVELTLKAFSIAGKPKDDVKLGKSPYATVQIDELYNKLQLIKAIKEATKLDLKEAKDFVDTIVSFDSKQALSINERMYIFTPFKIGPNERITVPQWKAIVNNIGDGELKWHFV